MKFHWSTQVFLNHLHVVLPRGVAPVWIPLLNVKTWSSWYWTCYAHTIRSQIVPTLNAWGCQMFSKYLYNSIFRVVYARDIPVRAEIQYNDNIVTVTTAPNKRIHLFEEHISRIATHIWCVWSCDPVCKFRRYTKRRRCHVSCITLDRVRDSLGDHHNRSSIVTRNLLREDRGVNDSQAKNAMHS